ncbi:hypothetical protein C8J34_11080 [Rhizobium sp. PP-F2F-G36]|nr:hypothetical protein C8J34_11080 [Rhizobium sp. PP-F2F-G36]
MKKQAISYAIIRFQPHIETEEFANIGIVLVAPRVGYLDFRLETIRIGRLTNFFDSVEVTTIRGVLKSYDVELTRIKDLAGYRADGQSRFDFEPSDNAEHLFHALTKDREGIIRFSDVRFAMTEDPTAKLDALFDYYVRRNFASSVYREGLLEKHVRNMLRLRAIDKNFKRRTFDDGIYSATFPFVEIAGDEPVKILKPIYLGQDDPTRILDHGNKWLFTIHRLKKLLPQEIVFAVEGPTGQSLPQRAFQETVEQFRKNGIQVVDATKERDVAEALGF